MEHKTRIDTRTIRTKENIRKTLEEMILEMDFHKITVSELTRRTEIDRKTFYLHYESLSEIFDELANDISFDIIELINVSSPNPKCIDFESLMKSYVAIHTANPKLHKRLFCTESYYMVFDKIQKRISEYLFEKISSQGTYDKDVLEATILFLTYGINAIWRKCYMENECITEEISSLTSTFIQSCWKEIPSQ